MSTFFQEQDIYTEIMWITPYHIHQPVNSQALADVCSLSLYSAREVYKVKHHSFFTFYLYIYHDKP